MNNHEKGGVDYLFPTPLYCSAVNNFEEIQKELHECATKIDFKMRDNTHHISDITFKENLIEKYGLELFEKELDFHVKKYAKELQSHCRMSAFDIGYNINSSWLSLFAFGDYGCVHSHDTTMFNTNHISGCYYFKTNGSDGNIFFESPLPFEAYRVKMSPEEGKILLFPSWLKHGIQKNMTDTTRISLSFNISFNMDINS